MQTWNGERSTVLFKGRLMKKNTFIPVQKQRNSPNIKILNVTVVNSGRDNLIQFFRTFKNSEYDSKAVNSKTKGC